MQDGNDEIELNDGSDDESGDPEEDPFQMKKECPHGKADDDMVDATDTDDEYMVDGDARDYDKDDSDTSDSGNSIGTMDSNGEITFYI